MIQPPVPPYGSPERDPGVPAPRPMEVVVGDPDAGTVLGEMARIVDVVNALAGEGVLAELNEAGYSVLPTDHVLIMSRQLTEAREALSAAREAGREEGRAEMWSAYSRQYEIAEKMPRWDQDKAVVTQGWAAGRCGNCGELLPDA